MLKDRGENVQRVIIIKIIMNKFILRNYQCKNFQLRITMVKKDKN